MASKSCANSGVSAALTRTMISLRQRSTFFTAYLTSSRAASFSSGETASSRSNMMASAPKKPQLVIIFGLFPGTKSMERLMRSLLPPVRARLPAGRAKSSLAHHDRLQQFPPAVRLRRAERCAQSVRLQRQTANGPSTSTSADSAAPAEASFRITTKIPPCIFFNISCCLQQIFLDKSRLYPLY